MMTVLIFIIFLIPLVFFHELGHFLFARYFGVRVEAFSIGFGPKVLKYKRGHTTYSVSLIPLGGYVKMLGSSILEKDKVEDRDRDEAYIYKTRWQRFWIVFGGPLANFILAFVIFLGLALVGESVPEPRVGVVFSHTELYRQGLRTGDMLKSAKGRSIFSVIDLATVVKDDKSFTLSVLRDGREVKLNIDMEKEKFITGLSSLPPALRSSFVVDHQGEIWGLSVDPEKFNDKLSLFDVATVHTGRVYLAPVKVFSEKGSEFDYSRTREVLAEKGFDNFIASLMEQFYWPMDLMVKQVADGSAAEKIGIQAGDVLVRLDGKSISHFHEIIHYLSKMKDTESVSLDFYHKGQLISSEITPEIKEINGEQRRVLGVYTAMTFSQSKMIQVPSQGFFASFERALVKTWETLVMVTMGFKKLILGAVSMKSVGGPIAIAKVAASSFAVSLSYFFKIMAVISINLGVINLVPLPVLDGGHILFLFFEGVTRRPISPRVVEFSMKFGVAVLFLLIFLALYNDIAIHLN